MRSSVFNPDVTTEERVQPWHYTLTGSDQKLHPAVKLHRQQLLQAEEQQDAAFAVLLSTTTLTLSRCKAWTKSSTALQQVFVGRNLITTVLTILWFRPVTTVLRWEHKDNDCSHSWLEITALPVLKHLLCRLSVLELSISSEYIWHTTHRLWCVLDEKQIFVLDN